jgi:RimJ/RimL family protein N-acetyltransferase
MRAIYLTGECVYLRALTNADNEIATAWFDSPFPIDATRAGTWLKETQRDPNASRRLDLVIARLADDGAVGGATLRTDFRIGTLQFHMAPALADADALRAEALRLLIPWLRDDLELMTVIARIAADEPATIAAAEALGMTPNARFREHVARPGHRVDMLMYQALFAPWQVVEHA